MKQQRIERSKPNKAPEIIDNRQPKVPDLPPPSPSVSNLPLRTVFMMEVGDATPPQVQLLVQEINKVYTESRGGPHYVVPVRHGKITSDLLFEAEWEKVVQETCEIHDGKIRLKGGAKECRIVREKI